MRFVLLLALLLALLPPSFGWTPSRADCCASTCECTSDEEPSCCKQEPAGPVYVAACGCGHSHGPLSVHRPAFDWFTVPSMPSPWVPRVEPVPSLVSEDLWPSRAPTPEPPPPRCGSVA